MTGLPMAPSLHYSLTGIPLFLLKRLQSVIDSATRLVFSSSLYATTSPQLHWLKASERIDFKLGLFVYKCTVWSSTVVSC